jgi:hypothetical protein
MYSKCVQRILLGGEKVWGKKGPEGKNNQSHMACSSPTHNTHAKIL